MKRRPPGSDIGQAPALAHARHHQGDRCSFADFLGRGPGPAVDRLRGLWAPRRNGGEFPIELAGHRGNRHDGWWKPVRGCP